MELRFKQQGVFYIPEYKNKKEEWVSFKKSEIENVRILNQIISHLTQIDTGDKFLVYAFDHAFFADTQGLYFRSEVTCMSFLGAAKSQFTNREVEFKI